MQEKSKRAELTNDFELGIEEVEVKEEKVPIKEEKYEAAVRVRITRNGVKDLVKGGVFVRGQIYSLAKSRADKIVRNAWGVEVTNNKTK